MSFGWHYLSNATCLIPASSVLRTVYSVKEHHNSPKYSPRSKKTCIRQVVLEKWLPLSYPNKGLLFIPPPQIQSLTAILARDCDQKPAAPDLAVGNLGYKNMMYENGP